jgi:hypothetical protein
MGEPALLQIGTERARSVAVAGGAGDKELPAVFDVRGWSRRNGKRSHDSTTEPKA